MLVSQLLPFSNNLATRKWSDEDILEDVQFLRDELKTRFESLTYVTVFVNFIWHDLSLVQNMGRIYLGADLRTPVLDTGPRIGYVLERECRQTE